MAARLRLLLIGAGHSHIEVLRRFGVRAERGVDIVVFDPQRHAAYSGMLPGVIAGHYRPDAMRIDTVALARRAGARFVAARIDALDLAARSARTDTAETIAFDIASLDVGSTPAPVEGAREHAIAAKPVDAFLDAWRAIEADARAGRIASIAVVGAGAGGVEALLAMTYALRGARSIAWHLVADTPAILPQHARAARIRLQSALARHGVQLHLGERAEAVDADGVRLANGTMIHADRVVWTTSAAPPSWLAAAGLASDHSGFVAVDDSLRSVSHPFVFAAGDCATQIAHPRPKSGVFAVRQGVALAANLRRALRGERTLPFEPQRLALALISTGGRSAVASFGPLAASGHCIWRWKDAIDRRFVAKYRTFARGPALE